MCQEGVLSLAPRKERVITPVNGAHKVVAMAIERGTLQNVLFDNQALISHRVLATIFGVIFNLSPVKQLLANKQLQSKYLERMMVRYVS